jgi:hypothetical protein
MLRTPHVNLASQTRSLSPRLASVICNNIRELSNSIAQKHSNTSTVDSEALADLKELHNAESDIKECRKSHRQELDAVEAAITILKGEESNYTGSHPLVSHAEQLVTQIAVVKSVDDNLSELDITDEIKSLEKLHAELENAGTVVNNRAHHALEATRKARGLTLCRCAEADTYSASLLLPQNNALPFTGLWPEVDVKDFRTLVEKSKAADKYDKADNNKKKSRIKTKIASGQLTKLRDVS